MKVAFRTDVSIQIGTGHLMRCLTLADALLAKGIHSLFICRELKGFSQKIIIDRGHDLQVLPAPDEKYQGSQVEPAHASWLEVSWQRDAEETKKILETNFSADCLIVDHYALDCRWENQLRSVAPKIVIIDDLADRRHECDILIDQTILSKHENYDKLVAKKCRILLGTQYALLRPQFRDYHKQAYQKHLATKSIKNILIAMGGADPYNMTEIALRGVEELNHGELSITVVLSSVSPYLDQIKMKSEQMDLPVSFLHDVKNMAEIMVANDFCIGGGGMSSWERCVVALPTLSVTMSENQKPINQALDNFGACIGLGWFDQIYPSDIRDAIKNIMRDMAVYKDMVEKSRRICDGLGLHRVVAQIEKL